MTMLHPQTGDIPLPYPTVVSKAYWDGCARGELLFQRCADCHLITHTPALVCAHCSSRNLSWERSAGTGAIYSWTTVWRPQTPAFTVPYTAIVVDMDEGWQMLSNLIGCEPDDARIGMRVQVEFHPLRDGITLPYFRPS
ncbi:MAG TPA: OB-fold domain-containing protein [Acidimicrobiales bacterium]|jgi:hypothetical protein|nr:OB-fold domain-containing protein [Acidimicrobiales bacterium]